MSFFVPNKNGVTNDPSVSQGTGARFTTISSGSLGRAGGIVTQNAFIIVDNETGVQYLNVVGSNGGTCVCPLYNADGSLLIFRK